MPETNVLAMAAPEQNWYAIRVKSNRERVVGTALQGKGFDICLPTYRVAAARKGTHKDVPLFPGYLLCQFDPRALLPVLTVPGVVNVLSRGRVPAAIEYAEMQAVLKLAESGLQAQPYPFFQQGQTVRLNYGPLSGVQGVIIREKGDLRLVVSLTLLSRSIVAEVDRGWVEAAAYAA